MGCRGPRAGLLIAVVLASALLATGAPAGAVPTGRAEVRSVAEAAMAAHDLRALVVRVTRDGKDLCTDALGESMTGVPATTRMHFRNGAMAFSYIGLIVAQLVDAGEMRLDDPLATWMPELPAADAVTVEQLLNMTSGYADYVYQPEVLDGVTLDPFRQWTGDELIRIGTSAPMLFPPGTNWAYSHTNYVILGRVIEAVTGTPLAVAMDQYVIGPLRLRNTSGNDDTPAIPEPVLHTFTSERREVLGVAAATPFTEDATFWNPSWTTAPGAVQTTDVYDMTRSMERIGRGALVSKRMLRLQTGNRLAGFGAADPTGACGPCRPLTAERSYGFGVILQGDWITQTKFFAGSGATTGYLPEAGLAITVVTTLRPEAFDETGAAANPSSRVFGEIARVLAPEASAVLP